MGLIVGADLHIEYNPYVAYPTLWGDSYFALEQLVSFALEKASPLILAGDTFEKAYVDSFSLRRTLQQIERMRLANLPIYFVQGNHDLFRRLPVLNVHDWPTHMDRSCFKLGDGLVAYGLDYQPATHLAEAMNSIHKMANVLVCHQAWAELMGEHLPSDGYLVDMVPDHIRLVIAGDYHGHRRLELINRNNFPFVVLSPGSASMQSLSEDSEKFFFHIQSDGVRSVPLRGRSVFRADLAEETKVHAELDRLRELRPENLLELPEPLRTPIWHIRLHSSLGRLAPTIEAAAEGVAHLFLRPLDSAARATASLPVAATSFDQALQQRECSAKVRQTATRLWRAANLQEEIKAVVDELMADAR